MTDPEAPSPTPQEPEAPAPGPRPHLPAWLAYGGTTLLVLLLAAFLVIQFALPEKDPPIPPNGEITQTDPNGRSGQPDAPDPDPPDPDPDPDPEPDPDPDPAPPVPDPPPRVTPQGKQEFEKALAECRRLFEIPYYDAAAAVVKAAVEKHGDPDGRAAKFLTALGERQKDAAGASTFGMGKARKEITEGKLFQGITTAKAAGRIYPERAKAQMKVLFDIVLEKLAAEPMKAVRGGAFHAGSDDEARFPPRPVTVKTFSIDPTEVTIEKYVVFCWITDRPLPQRWNGNVPRRSDHPVSSVTYADAQAYAAWLGRRLPTADEWELAARWIDGRKYPWGDRWQVEADEPLRANTLEFGYQRGGVGTMPVGHFSGGASPYEVLDMAGNVWEWTTSTRIEKGETLQVLKGGSFLTPARTAVSAHGMLEDPDMAHPDVGFRCVRSDPE